MDNRRLVVPSPDQGGNAPAPGFPGFSIPSQDFQAVRDDRRSKPLMYTIDLSSARSISAGTALALPLQGNVFYSDPLYDLSGNSVAGVARVHFQDQSLNPVGTYFTVQPQFICKVPFTQLLVENYAQPGKFLQVVYGVDLDVIPGLSNLTQTTISGNVNTNDIGAAWATSYKSTTALAAFTPENIFSAASNVSGGTLWSAQNQSAFAGASYVRCSWLMKATAPATLIDGDVLLMNENNSFIGVANSIGFGQLKKPLRFNSGKRLDFLPESTESNAQRMALYTLN